MKENDKTKDMASYVVDSESKNAKNTNFGTKISDDHQSLKAGLRGPTLLEDFILREKIAHFDRERIPERVVHARGTAVHGVFKVYESLEKYTCAQFLTDPSAETPVFVRFSTVAGSKGSTDLARDVRGFAVKFYTQEGNFDLVGNNIPVFFIQDAMKFPDLVHSVKPEQDNEMPQAGSAHDTFWDFISLMPEASHMIMWAMSDRGIPRSLRMIEGFGVHTFKLVNAQGEVHFVKFHWKPLLGVHSVAWDEAQRISGKDSDFHRRDLLENIQAGNFPEWELGLQIIPEADEHKFEFDILDPTKLIPEEMVPVQIVGKMTLNRVPDNFFAEVEQVAYAPANIVPGIDFSNDPLLQGRIFSYTDTHMHRLGTSNFHQIPINRTLNTVHNNQRDGFGRMQIEKGKINYTPNSIGGGCPYQSAFSEGGFATYPQPTEGTKVRGKSEKFFDHFSQAKLFFNSQSEPEKTHLKNAIAFELSKVTRPEIRERMVKNLTNISMDIAHHVAEKLGLPKPDKVHDYVNHAVPAGADPKDHQPVRKDPPIEKSAALSMANTVKNTIKTRDIATFIADGFDEASFNNFKKKIEAEGGKVSVIAPRLGDIKGSNGGTVTPDKTFFNCASVLHDAVYMIGGEKAVEKLADTPEAVHFMDEAFKHCKPIGCDSGCDAFIAETHMLMKLKKNTDAGVITNGDVDAYIKAVAQHRFWEREEDRKIPS